MAAKRITDDTDSAAARSPGSRERLAGEPELWERFARDHDPAIREELVRRNMAFAKRLVLRYRGASESFDDLLQVANPVLRGVRWDDRYSWSTTKGPC